MMYFRLIKFCFLFNFIFSTFSFSTQTFLKSDIFAYDDFEHAKSLRVSLKGEGFCAREIRYDDLKWHQEFFGDNESMRYFGNGLPRSSESVAQRVQESIKNRFGQGHPHGLLVATDPYDDSKILFHVIAGGGDRPGTSEIAYGTLPKYQGLGFGMKIVHSLVKEWAPEVRKIGLNLHNQYPQNISNAFRCFGGQVLDSLDATTTPVNVASWKILDKCGFRSAQYGVHPSRTFDFDSTEYSFEELEADLIGRYNPQNTPDPLVEGIRYHLIDMNGKDRTFSFGKWKRIKFHFEKPLI